MRGKVGTKSRMEGDAAIAEAAQALWRRAVPG